MAWTGINRPANLDRFVAQAHTSLDVFCLQATQQPRALVWLLKIYNEQGVYADQYEEMWYEDSVHFLLRAISMHMRPKFSPRILDVLHCIFELDCMLKRRHRVIFQFPSNMVEMNKNSETSSEMLNIARGGVIGGSYSGRSGPDSFGEPNWCSMWLRSSKM